MKRYFAALVLVLGLHAADGPLSTLRTAHPRLIASGADFGRLRDLVASDSLAGAMYAKLQKQADAMLKQQPIEHRLIGPRLLDQSRLCLDRVYTLAMVYRLSGDKRYLDRAVLEMKTAAGFADWNPSHFLDVAEMTHALAIGYDWLYADLSADDRATIRHAIVGRGLDEAIKIYKDHRWWVTVTHNWNQVCNGGITLGALAVAEDEPEKAAYIVGQSVDSIRRAMNSYAPEGGWAEGPGYWQYATSYNVFYLAGLETALGKDFGLSATPGFAHAGDFRVYFQGPTGQTFNYADAHPGAGTAPEMFWLARKFDQPVFAGDELRHLKANARPSALDLLWYTPQSASLKEAGWPLSRMFRGVDVAFLRSDWDDPKALWIAVKGGDNQANHSHLDLGSFVLEKDGVRWAVDLGGDDYNMPGYFGKERFTYYRLKTESHNTVAVDGENQNAKAKAPMQMRDGAAVIDLSQAYAGKLTSWTRTVRIADSNAAVIVDEIAANRPVDAAWGMVTEGDVKLDGARATLSKGNAILHAEIVSPQGAAFELVATNPGSPQNANLGTKRLIVRLSGKVKQSKIEVRLQ
jgi:hypothetical protein